MYIASERVALQVCTALCTAYVLWLESFSQFICTAGVTVDSPNAVVVGLAPSQFHYGTLNEAFR